jgi:ribosomal protein L28
LVIAVSHSSNRNKKVWLPHFQKLIYSGSISRLPHTISAFILHR